MPSTYAPIATQTLGSAASSVTFSSIPSTYTDLVCVISGSFSAAQGVYVRFNNDSGSNYSSTFITGNGSAASSSRSTSDVWTPLGYLGTDLSNTIFSVMNYANTTTNKTGIGRGNTAAALTFGTVGLWRSTAAINRLDIQPTSGTITTGTTLTLYGIKAA
jgi:hypothetical protein